MYDQKIVPDEAEYANLHPHIDLHSNLDMIRFLGVFIYIIDYLCKILYVHKSKFVTLQIRDLYVKFLWWRAAFVCIYAFCTAALRIHSVYWKGV